MSEEHATPSVAAATVFEPNLEPIRSQAKDRTIIIRMWPKTPVLYPMALVALICCFVSYFAGSSDLRDYPFATDAPAAAVEPGEPAQDERPAVDGEGEGASVSSQPSVLPAQAAPPAVDADPTVSGQTAAAAAEELEKKRVDRTLAVIFLITLFFSLFAICVDLDVRWAIIFTSSIVIVGLVLWILNITMGFIPKLLAALDHITPMSNPQFYLGVFLVWLLLMAVSFIITRFHYVRIEANEVIVVGGMLERQQRYDTMRMRYTKEIHDVMEYYLPFVRSGRLIISFPEQSEAVIIDNVINIKKVTRRLDEVVGSLSVSGHSH
jgi:hypothetical protein